MHGAQLPCIIPARLQCSPGTTPWVFLPGNTSNLVELYKEITGRAAEQQRTEHSCFSLLQLFSLCSQRNVCKHSEEQQRAPAPYSPAQLRSKAKQGKCSPLTCSTANPPGVPQSLPAEQNSSKPPESSYFCTTGRLSGSKHSCVPLSVRADFKISLPGLPFDHNSACFSFVPSSQTPSVIHSTPGYSPASSSKPHTLFS